MHKISRRKFIYSSVLLPSAISYSKDFHLFAKETSGIKAAATWDFGQVAVDKAIEVMEHGGTALDAVEKGANVIEEDPSNLTVGLGGSLDEDGALTLDAGIMDWNGNVGAVGFLQNILHPISVAKLVMEKTKHVMLVGEGALKFALKNGFEKTNLITKEAEEEYLQRKHKFELKNNHDTIGIIAIDGKGNISVGTSTSGSAFKIHGRVGDSPIAGAGFFADNKVGGAVATGLGEVSMKTLGSFLIVEKMREGYSPMEACKIAVERAENSPSGRCGSICYLAMNKAGEVGAYATYSGFEYAVGDSNGSDIYKSKFLRERNGK